MSRHARIRNHVIALSIWLASFAWLAWGPHQPGIHRTILSVAIAATVIVAIDARALDLSETIRLAKAAGYQQAQVDALAER